MKASPTARRQFSVALGTLVASILTLSAGTTRGEEQSLNPLHAIGKETLKNFRERPLFNPVRSEPHAVDASASATAEAAPASPEPPPQLSLVGVVSGDRSVAVVRLASSGKTTTLASGDKIGAWNVTVLPTGLRLEADTRRVDIALFAPKTGSTTPPSSPTDAGIAVPPAPGQTPPSGTPTP